MSTTDGSTSAAGTCRTTLDGTEVACAPNPPAPSAAALAACSGKAAGDSCSETATNGDSFTGACATASDGDLACAHVFTPPPAAISACAGLTSGAACTLPDPHHGSADGGTGHAGICTTDPEGSLACALSHTNPSASTACAGLAAGATCTLSSGPDSVTGTCETPADGGSAVCATACGSAGHPFNGPPPNGSGGHDGSGGNMGIDGGCGDGGVTKH